MADTVATQVVGQTADDLIIHCLNISDGTGETTVIKADKSAYLARDGAEPASLDIAWVRWAVQGFTSVRLLWDHTTDDRALVLSGSGYDDFRGASQEVVPTNCYLKDPRSAGGPGDLILTTAGASSGATYDITIGLRKQAD